MRLAVIGDTQHYYDDEGRICALEPVVNQLDRWAELFDHVVLCAPLDPGPPPAGFAPYQAANISLEPLRRSGGNTLLAKLRLVTHIIPWFVQTRRVARSVDAVHLRCPCNIGLIAIFSTWRAGCLRYAMYAGVWQGYDGEPYFFGLQRRLLATRWFGGPVSVYASRDASRPHLEPFFSPSFSAETWRDAAPAADKLMARIADETTSGPWQLVTVGRLTDNKNQQTIVRAVADMVALGLDVQLAVYGDGPNRDALEGLARSLGMAERVSFRGSVSHGAVMEAFASSDISLLSTRQEGYGKVLLECMVYGVVPVFGESPVAAEISGAGTRGFVIDPDDHEAMAARVADLVGDRVRWLAMARNARDYTETMTLDAFQDRVRELLERQWKVELVPSTGVR